METCRDWGYACDAVIQWSRTASGNPPPCPPAELSEGPAVAFRGVRPDGVTKVALTAAELSVFWQKGWLDMNAMWAYVGLCKQKYLAEARRTAVFFADTAFLRFLPGAENKAAFVTASLGSNVLGQGRPAVVLIPSHVDGNHYVLHVFTVNRR